MSSSKYRDNRQNNVPPTDRVMSPGSVDTQLYVNLNQTRTGKRTSNNESNRNSTSSSSIQPLTTNNVNKLYPSDNKHKNSNSKNPKGWYSPPNSVQSDSRPPSLAGAKFSQPKRGAKLQTIEENALTLPTDKILSLCTHSDVDIQSNALAFLQHLIYNNNEKKLEVRNCNGIRIILDLSRSKNNVVANAALGVLKNMSYTELEMIITDIERLSGIQRIMTIIEGENDIYQKEMAIDILWNLSVHYDLKNIILTETVPTLVQYIIIPESKLIKQKTGNYIPFSDEVNWSLILRNTLGIIRNISYESKKARYKLRDEDGLIDAILHLIYMAKGIDDMDEDSEEFSLINSKIVENCVCILRNLTYAIQEVADPYYLQTRDNSSPRPPVSNKAKNQGNKSKPLSVPLSENPKGVELLLHAKYVVAGLIPILKYSANAITLEAAAGVIQNESAGDWEPSKEMQVQFRLQLALPHLVELIDLGTNEVIRSAATALRNLVREEFTCMLVGTNGLKILTEKIPYHSKNKKINAVALAAVLSTVYAIIKNQEEFMKEFVLTKGTERCIYVRDSTEYTIPDNEHPDKVEQFAKHILQLLWKTPSTKELLKKNNFKQSDIINSKTPDSSHSSTSYKSGKPPRMQDSTDYRYSVNTDNRSELSHNKFARDSCSTIVSNSALQKRNSKAYTTNVITGYGQVRVPAKQKRNGQEADLQRTPDKYTVKAESNNDIEEPYYINPFIYKENTKYSNDKNSGNHVNLSMNPNSKSSSNIYTSNRDDESDYTPSKHIAHKTRRRPPSVGSQRESEASNNTNLYKYEYSTPIRPINQSKPDERQKKNDSWV